MIDPFRSANDAPAIWRADTNPSVVMIAAADEDVVPLIEAGGSDSVLADCKTPEGRHLILEIEQRRYRLLVVRSETATGYLMPADSSLPVRMAATSALHASTSHNVVPSHQASLRPSPYKKHRLNLLLAILDRMDRRGTKPPTLRGLARDLVFPGLDVGTAIEWKTSSQRRQVQRLIVEARRMASQGVEGLLGHSSS